MKIECPNCGLQYELDDSETGRKVLCSCDHKFIANESTIVKVSSLQNSEIRSTPKKTVNKERSSKRKTSQKADRPPPATRKFALLPVFIILLLLGGGFYFFFLNKPQTKSEPSNAQKILIVDNGVENVKKLKVPEIKKSPEKVIDPLSLSQLSIKELPSLKKSLEKKLTLKLKELGGNMSTVMDDPKYISNLTRYEIVRSAGNEILNQLASKPDGGKFLEVFLNDRKWMNKVLASGPIPSTARTLYYLYYIWHLDKDCLKPIYQNLATATALEQAELDYKGEPNTYNMMLCFKKYKDAHKNLLLHSSFDKLQTWEMRFVVLTSFRGWSNDYAMAHDFILNDRHYQTFKYPGACWSCAYRGYNSMGDSVQGWRYYVPWTYKYSWPEAARKVGGVCGSLSTYGASSAQVHGIPAMTAGQPGHCAHIIRHGKNWQVAYGVTWPTYPHNAFWGWTFAYLPLMEDAFKDSNKVLKAKQYTWQAHLYDNINQKPKALKAYQLALKENPLNYGIWLEYGNWLTSQPSVSHKQWLSFADSATRALVQHQEPAWHFIQKFIGKTTAGMSRSDKMAFFLKCHRILTVQKVKSFSAYPFDVILNSQAKLLGNKNDVLIKYFQQLIQIHNQGDYFNRLMSWGSQRFSKDKKYSSRLSQIIVNVLKKNAGKMGPGGLSREIGKYILSAENNEDAQSYKIYNDLAKQLIKSKKPIKKSKMEFKRFPGVLLSRNGMLKLSSTSRWDTPLLHHALISDEYKGGNFHTNKEGTPSITVLLPGKCKISGIVIKNVESNTHRQIPLLVSVSTDGKKWKKLYKSSKNKKIWLIDLKNKNIEAKYVKVEADHTKNADYFHLRNILIYGKKLF